MEDTLKLYILCAIWILAAASTGTCHHQVVIKANPIRFTTEAATRETYIQFIEAFREQLSSGVVHDIPVLRDPSLLQQRDRYITVELSNSVNEFVTIGIDLTNAYVVAFSAGSQSYFLQDAPDSAPTYLFAGTQQYSLPFSGSYTDLERWANRGRENIPLGLEPLRHAIWLLRTESSENAERARSLIVIIQMVSEAARFRLISNRVARSVRGNEEFQPDPAMLSLENNWGGMSEGVQQAVQGTFQTPVTLMNIYRDPVVVDSLTHRTVSVLALMLFVCRPEGVQSPMVIKPIVEKSEICNVFEPKVRISGRNGMCVDVANNDYHNGNGIIIWPCGRQLQENQLWTLKQDKTIRSQGKCLTTYGYAAGNYVMIFDCATAVPEATYWEIWQNGTIINPRSGLVLSAENGTQGGTLTVEKNENRIRHGWKTGNNTDPLVTAIAGYLDLCMEASGDGTSMSMATCDLGKEAQRWALYSDGSIRPIQRTSRCLTSNNHFQGTNIILVDCSFAWASQRWIFENDGTIYNLHNEMVMEAIQSNSSWQVRIWPFTGNENQQWTLLLN